MSLDPEKAELLQYLADLGWAEMYRQAPPGAPSGAQKSPGTETREAEKGSGKEEEAKASSKGEASASTVGPSRAEADAAPFPAGDGSGGYVPGSSAPPSEHRPLPVRLPAAEVVAQLDALAAVVAGCRQCKLCTTRTQTVFASGDPRARLMLIGEGPGAEEDKQGLPFVGAAGELLNKILAAIDLRRDEVYVANIVKCRPPGNRDPEPDEVRACRGYLERQIDLVRPEVLVALGRVPAQILLGVDSSLARLRGEWHTVQGVPMRATFHPAALLRNTAWKRPTWEDMQLVRNRLRENEAARGPGEES